MALLMFCATILIHTALEERIGAYHENKTSLSDKAQAKALTFWRSYCPSLAAVNAQSQQNTLKRLDLAYQAFVTLIGDITPTATSGCQVWECSR